LALLGINVVKPDYFDEVMESPLFIPAALIVCAFLVVNIIVMRALVDIKV
jgi:tight adherence protein B